MTVTVKGQITIPQDAVEVQISPQGLVSVRTQGSQQFQDVGQIQLALAGIQRSIAAMGR